MKVTPQAVLICKSCINLALCEYNLPKRLKGHAQEGQVFLKGDLAIPDTGFCEWDTLETGFQGLQLLKFPCFPSLKTVLNGRPAAPWSGFHGKYHGLRRLHSQHDETAETVLKAHAH